MLREQDAVPELVTHVLRINDEGEITSIGPRSSTISTTSSSSTASQEPLTGTDLIRSNENSSIGVPSNTTSEPLIALKDVSIVYGTKAVLDSVSLTIHPGTRLILAGDNGSGKTTLLALLLGDHPKSFSFPSSSLSLFGNARDHPSNARTLLNRKPRPPVTGTLQRFPPQTPRHGRLDGRRSGRKWIRKRFRSSSLHPTTKGTRMVTPRALC